MTNQEKVFNAFKISHGLQWNNIVLKSSRSLDFVIVMHNELHSLSNQKNPSVSS